MEPQKKVIKVKKPNGGSQGGQSGSPQYQQGGDNKIKTDSLKILENTVKKLSSRFAQYGFNDSKEEDFLNENKDKNIILELLNNESVDGTLESIDKYRIGIKINDKMHYFYKHAIIGYYIK